jgi:hypothetical protein
MTRHKISNDFHLDEFIYPELHKQYGASGIWFVDRRIIAGMQYLRDKSGRAIHINDWAHGGTRDERGLRHFNSPVGARLSQHKFGRAADSNMEGFTTKQYFDFVMSHEKELIEFGWITTIENIESTPTWLHCDCRYTGLDKILIVNP